MEWMILPLKRYADFKGRSQRMEYWMFTLLYYLVFTVIGMMFIAGLPWTEILAEANTLDGPNGLPRDQEQAEPGPLFWGALTLMLILWVVTIIPSIAVTVRRFHDQNLSGWLYLLGFIPYVGWLVIIVFMCIDGNKGPNQYGDDPKGTGSASVFE